MKYSKGKFRVAFKGLRYLIIDKAVLTQLVITILVVGAFIFLKASLIELCIIITLCALVVISEMVNTCLEKVCNEIDESYNKKIGIIKDMAAGFVLMASIFAAIIGLIILKGLI